MPTLRILSAGAAQAVTERIIEAFKRDTGADVTAAFGAVGAMKARLTGGEGADVIILTRAMIDEMAAEGALEQGSRVDLGTVGTGVAVRAGSAAPDVTTPAALRAAILAAGKVVCPDPAIATAGKVVMSVMDKLGIVGDVRARMQLFPNGYAAMNWLAASGAEGDLGITQVTEIKPNRSVTYVGPLPEEFQMKAVYSAGLVTHAAERERARNFISRYAAADARALLTEAGFEL